MPLIYKEYSAALPLSWESWVARHPQTRLQSINPCSRHAIQRRFLAISAGASFVGTGSLAAAATAPNDVPQTVTMPIGPDPI